MLIECPHCRSRVDAKELGTCSEPRFADDYHDELETRVVVAKCSSCERPLVGLQKEYDHPEFGSVWSDGERIWPFPRRTIARSVPDIVKVSLAEADTCFHAGAYAAAAVMCGRAIEGVCVHFDKNKKRKRNVTLAVGLKTLLENDVIDKRLYNWGEALREIRNFGAHATEERVQLDDARDVLDFAHAITDYVFVLNEQFDRFMKRKDESEAE